MSPGNNNSYKNLSRALRQVVLQPELATKLKTQATRGEAIEELDISDELATEILVILHVITPSTEAGDEPFKQRGNWEEGNNQTDKQFLLESFDQLRTTYRISLFMSTAIFLVGIAFLVIAAVSTFTQPESVEVTSVIGGIGIIQIVALFYHNPLADVARTVSNAQQGKVAVMSYLLGISLVNQQIGMGRPSGEHLANLSKLTESTLGQLQMYVEGSIKKERHAQSTLDSQKGNDPGQ